MGVSLSRRGIARRHKSSRKSNIAVTLKTNSGRTIAATNVTIFMADSPRDVGTLQRNCAHSFPNAVLAHAAIAVASVQLAKTRRRETKTRPRETRGCAFDSHRRLLPLYEALISDNETRDVRALQRRVYTSRHGFVYPNGNPMSLVTLRLCACLCLSVLSRYRRAFGHSRARGPRE